MCMYVCICRQLGGVLDCRFPSGGICGAGWYGGVRDRWTGDGGLGVGSCRVVPCRTVLTSHPPVGVRIERSSNGRTILYCTVQASPCEVKSLTSVVIVVDGTMGNVKPAPEIIPLRLPSVGCMTDTLIVVLEGRVDSPASTVVMEWNEICIPREGET